MSAHEAARAARRQFGNVTALKERQRAQRGILSPTEWWRDVRFGLRMLAKRPGFERGRGGGAGAGDWVELRGVHVCECAAAAPSARRKGTNSWSRFGFRIRKPSGIMGYLPFNYPDYAYYRDHSKSLEGLLAFDGDGEDAIWNHEGNGEILHVQFVSGNLFSLLGVNAVVGRTLSVDDDRHRQSAAGGGPELPVLEAEAGRDRGGNLEDADAGWRGVHGRRRGAGRFHRIDDRDGSRFLGSADGDRSASATMTRTGLPTVTRPG